MKLRNPRVMQQVIRLMSLSKGATANAVPAASLRATGHQPARRGLRGVAIVPRLLCRGRPLRGQAREGRSGSVAQDDDLQMLLMMVMTTKVATSLPTSGGNRNGRGRDEIEPAGARTGSSLPVRIGDYTEAEKLFGGEPRIHRKGKFIYRYGRARARRSRRPTTPGHPLLVSTPSRNC